MKRTAIALSLFLAGCSGEYTTPIDLPASNPVTLYWTAPIENTDDSVLEDLAGFKVYYSIRIDNLNEKIIINDPYKTDIIIEDLVSGQVYYFAVTAFNELGIESELSNIVTYENY